MHRIVRSSLFLSMLLGALSHAQTRRAAPVPQRIAPGIERIEIATRTRADAQPMRVWIYRPIGLKADAELPCVLIAPAGSTGINGIRLVEEDVQEHLPYVAEGCIVVAYDLDGSLPEGATNDEFVEAMKQFMLAGGGVANAHAALDAAIFVERSIDVSRLFAAGHSSAANVALLLAAKDDRIRGVVAYAPASNVVDRVGAIAIEAFDQVVPGFTSFVHTSQPITIAKDIACPTMLFHAADDEVIPVDETRALIAAMTEAGHEPTAEIVKTGGHSEALISVGLSHGSAWIGELARRIKANEAASPTTRVPASVDAPASAPSTPPAAGEPTNSHP